LLKGLVLARIQSKNGKGDWKTRQQGVNKRRTWRKLHIVLMGIQFSVVAFFSSIILSLLGSLAVIARFRIFFSLNTVKGIW
jgi:hypothetical protein